uniref:Ankyrin repeat and sterile alpha motif domain containing 1B n=4 Tax=Nothobranchius TaxID=28779 RepID=A0A8C6KXP8_NOTFU
MGKEQELLEAARTGNVALVEKLLSGKKGILGSGSGSIPLPNLLSMWKGLNVNCTDSSGYTPLHHAALNGHRDVVLKLLQFEASTTAADSKGCFPLHLAAWRGDVDIVRILINHGPTNCYVNQQNHERETPLHCAAQYGHSEVVSVLLQELTDPTMRNNRQETPLDLAALYGRLQVVRMLVSAHPNLMSSHTRLHTPLHLAARNGHHTTIQTLLEAGMDVNCVTENGSALHEAALFGKMDVVRLLLDSGIEASLRDSRGRTALEILKEHPAPKSQQITALIQEPELTPDMSISSSLCPDEAVTSELSKLLHDVKKCRDRDYSFEELCHTISCHSMDSFGSGRLSDEDRPDRPNGTLTRGTRVGASVKAGTRSRLLLSPNTLENVFLGIYGFYYKQMFILLFSLPPADDGSYQREPPPPAPPPCSPPNPNPPLEEHRKSLIPEEFAGLLHGSSPACDPPDTPYHLYSPKHFKYTPADGQSSLLQNPEFSIVIGGGASRGFSRTGGQSSPQRFNSNSPKPQVVYRTVFHTKVNQDQVRTRNCEEDSAPVWSSLSHPPSCPTEQNGEVPQSRENRTGGESKEGLSGASYEERACTLGRMRSVPRSVLDLQLSKSLSKSDSNLVAISPIQVRAQHMAGSFDSHFARHNMMWQCQLSQPDCRCYRVDGYSLLKRLPLHPLIGPRCPLQSVGQWLDSIGLVQYENHLLANGFDNVQFMGSNVVEDQDLLEIGILNSAHRQRLLQAIRLLPRVRPVGYDGNNPTSVAEWLESLELGDYTKSFLINGYTSMELVKKIWEIELINVLKINLIGHRKRILASLGDRLHDDTPQKPPRAISLRVMYNSLMSIEKSTLSQRKSYAAVEVSLMLSSRSVQTTNWCEPITLRPPNEATSSTPVQYWQHHPEKLIFQSCDYEAYYLGSMLVKELRGIESTQDACAKMRKSTEQMKKVPTIVLSVSYKGVKFIDATNKNIIAEHEIRNISCAAQDPEDLSTFAYITKDLKSSHHYCHVFTAFDVNLAYEIILTLGQAFEVAYQLALQARKSGHGSSTLPESFDSKPGKPIPKPRINIRKSVSINSVSNAD